MYRIAPPVLPQHRIFTLHNPPLPPPTRPTRSIYRSWEKDGQAVTSVVFERGSLVPSAKMLTFYRSEPFAIRAEYTPDSDIPATADRSIGAPG